MKSLLIILGVAVSLSCFSQQHIYTVKDSGMFVVFYDTTMHQSNAVTKNTMGVVCGSAYNAVYNLSTKFIIADFTNITVHTVAPTNDSACRLFYHICWAVDTNTLNLILTGDTTTYFNGTGEFSHIPPDHWTLSGSNLYNNSGVNVGIGTPNPSTILNIYGNSGIAPFLIQNNGEAMFQTYPSNYSISQGDLTYDNDGIRFDISDQAHQFSWGWWTDTAMTLKGQDGAPKLLTVNGAIWSLGEDSFTNFAGKTSSVIMLHNAIDHSQPGPCLYYSPDTSVHVLSGYCAKFLACSDINDYGDSSVAVMSAGDNQGNQCFMGLCGQTKKWALNLTGYQNVAFVYNDTSLWAVGSQLAGQPNPVSVLSANLLAQKVSITDGSQAQGTVLTGDSNGVATWGYAVLPHYIFTPTTLLDTVYTVTNAVNIINSTAATLVISLPSTPKNNDRVELKFNQAHAAITYTNGTINGGLASSVIGSFTVLTYDSANSAWY